MLLKHDEYLVLMCLTRMLTSLGTSGEPIRLAEGMNLPPPPLLCVHQLLLPLSVVEISACSAFAD